MRILQYIWLVVAAFNLTAGIINVTEGNLELAFRDFTIVALAVYISVTTWTQLRLMDLSQSMEELHQKEINAERRVARHFMDEDNCKEYQQTVDGVDEVKGKIQSYFNKDKEG